MHRALVTLLVVGSIGASGTARAQDGAAPEDPDDEDARALFRAGVEAAAQGDWEAAAAHFVASVEREARVAPLYNLVIAYGHLERRVELAYAVDRMRTLADPERHAVMLERAERLRADVLREIGVIELAVTPIDATVSIDGHAHADGGEARIVYLTEGAHALHLEAEGHEPRQIDLTIRAGTQIGLRVALEPRAQAEPGPELPVNPFTTGSELPSSSARPVQGGDESRPILAGALWTGGVAAWVAGVALQGVTWSESGALATTDPTASGFLSRAQRYGEQRMGTIALAVSAAVLASAATLVWPWRAGDERAAWWIAAAGSALVVAGAVLVIRAPDRLGYTRLTDPVRELGALLVSGGAPLVLAPVAAWLNGELWGGGSNAEGGLAVAGAF